jgi:hypothetical protein
MHLLHITEREALALIAGITTHTPIGATLEPLTRSAESMLISVTR